MGKGFTKKTKRLLLRKILPAGIGLVACAGCAYGVNSAQYRSRFLPGTFINGINVTDQTIDEAEANLRNKEEDYALTLRFRFNEEETLDKDDLKLSFDCADELQTILDQQNGIAWIIHEFSEPQAYTLKTKLRCDDAALAETLSALPELSPDNIIEPVDANLSFNENDLTFKMVPEIDGTRLDQEALADAVRTAVSGKESVLDLNKTEGIYEAPKIRSGDEALTNRLNSLNKLLGVNITVTLSDGVERVIDKNVTKDWIAVNKEGLYVVDEAAIAASCADYVATLAKYDDCYGYYRGFASTNYGMQRFDSENLHGHTLDQAAMSEKLKTMILNGESGTLEPVYSEYEDDLDPRFGGTYVEVDIYAQRVYYYENYELVYDCDCVTGTEGYRSTPSGIFSIQEKQHGRYLNGYTSDGQLAYSSYVEYWMCFYPHYGLHDAQWRGSFGGDIYTYDGSHGCVNLPYSAAETLYSMLEYDTPVIILRGQSYEDESEETESHNENTDSEYYEEAEETGY